MYEHVFVDMSWKVRNFSMTFKGPLICLPLTGTLFFQGRKKNERSEV